MRKSFLVFLCAIVCCFVGCDVSSKCNVVSQNHQLKVSEKYAEMNKQVQRILDELVKSGAQSAVQCCAYIDGELAVDAWAGTYKKGGIKKIDATSLFPVFSTEKPLLATAVHRAVEMGKMRYDMKISELWQEFSKNGKQDITLHNIITHHSGLQPHPDNSTTDAQFCDWSFMLRQCENFKPQMKPATKSVYLGITYAWLLGEPLSRAMKKPCQDVLKELVLIPTGIDNDFFFGITQKELPRCVELNSESQQEFYMRMNKNMYRFSCIPSFTAMANARGIAKFYSVMVGSSSKPTFLKSETLKKATTLYLGEGEAMPVQRKGCWNPKWGMGYTLNATTSDYGNVFGQGGLGGSDGMGNLKHKIAYGFTCATYVNPETEKALKKIQNIIGIYSK